MTSQEVALRDETDKAVAFFRQPEVLEQIQDALPEGESPRRFVRTLVTALMERPDLVKADRQSLITAVFKCAQMNLQPDGREAVINVYNTKVKIDGKDVWIQKATLIPMVDGYAKNVGEYGWSLIADVVYENDTFDEGSTEKPLFHRRAKLGTDRGKPIGAYALAMHGTRGFRQAIYTPEEIERVRQSSKQPGGDLWTKWWDRAWKKTVAKYVAKHLPLDSKDREQLMKRLDVEDLNGDDAKNLLYGSEDRRVAGASLPAPADAREGATLPSPAPSASPEPDPEPDEEESVAVWEPIPDEADLPPWEGEEPEIHDEPEPAPAEQDEPKFTSGRHEGKTIPQIYAIPDDGPTYIRWAFKNWKTEPLRSALDRFAESHPEIKGKS